MRILHIPLALVCFLEPACLSEDFGGTVGIIYRESVTGEGRVADAKKRRVREIFATKLDNLDIEDCL